MLALSLFALAAVWQPGVGSADAATITVFPADPPNTGNCYPFGIAGGGVTWTPFAGFVYKNIPPFELSPGDTLAFDTNAVNNVDVQLDIALSRTTANGNDILAPPYFTTVVTNTQTPLNPRGDTVQGNFEMQFTAQATFSFPGGGLIMRFSNPSAAYATDLSCTGNLVAGATSDSSGLFVERFFNDVDGVDPWSPTGTSNIGAFRITTFTALPVQKPSNAFTLGKPKLNKKRGTAKLPVTVPGAGNLTLAGKGVVKQRPALASRAVSAAGTVKLLVKSKGKKKRTLDRTGNVKVKVKVTYTPTGGSPSTQTKRIKLIKRL
jgi:hypothetical protein